MRKLLALPNFILFLLIIAAALFLFNAAAGDSAIFDETAHIVAGYTYVRHLDYRFNPEHPPLVKMLAGLPLLFQNINFDTSKGYWNGSNEQWWAGNEFLYKSGNDADKIIFWARTGPILLALLTIIFIYIFAKELLGRWWALLPAFLFGFSPIVLAHGHYVTTDVAATLGALLTLYSFLKLLEQPGNKNLWLAGLAFGFAQAVKFSSVLLIPALFLISIFYAIANFENFWRYSYRNLKSWLSVIAIGYLFIVYPLYLLTTWNYPLEKQVVDTETILQNFGFPPLAFLDIQMAKIPAWRPLAQYLLGVLMVFQRSAGGNNAYFLGELSSHGWRYYFPLIYLMKEPLPILLLIFLGSVLGILRMIRALRHGKEIGGKFKEYLTLHFWEFSSLVFIILYWISSITSPLNIGVRHILPTVPFIYILVAGAIKKWFSAKPADTPITFLDGVDNFMHAIFSFWLKTLVISAAIIWLVLETMLAAPHFLSYYNQFFGWRTDGFYYATDSNFDWGQDLKRLKKWAEENLPREEKLAVDYFGGGDPNYYLGEQFVPWWSAKGSPKDEGIGWLAISVNTLQGALAKPAADFYRNPTDEYRWLENPYGFVDRAGTSIFIYKL
ncbi:MAG: glycosyltransferase family 39 protein [Candidatus Harrisonbacteria bacterium]|nr:glycosyltransferase family 39 protein [Candidatus Harrisonbacteria bacterium]